MNALSRLRWRIFVFLSYLGWWVCPEPHRTILKAQMSLGTQRTWEIAMAGNDEPTEQLKECYRAYLRNEAKGKPS